MRHISLVTLVLLEAGCSIAELGDPTQQVASLELRADALGALKATACIDRFGEQGCSPYPNPLACDAMSITIRRGGQTCARCVARGVEREVCGGFLDGIPIVCRATEDLSCQRCLDLYGNTVHDSCNRAAQLFRTNQSGWNELPGGAGYVVEEPGGSGGATPANPPESPQSPPQTPQSPPASGGNSACDASKARQKYAEELNKLLAKEGLSMKYKPVLGSNLLAFGNLWGALGYSGYGGDVCKQYLKPMPLLDGCWSDQPGKCFCRAEPGQNKQTCRCARITVAALRTVCQQIPPGCDYNTWVGAYAMEFGSASAWMNSTTYAGGFFSSLLPMLGGPTASSPPSCLYSPLVLDLDDDGVAPTGPGAVTFDLLGQGPVRTGWIEGDDALLTLDRDGNGLVDDGTELFGEGTRLNGVPARDGFQALAALDEPAAGGNGNGVLEDEDLMFGALRVWTDRNVDGVSQPEELRDLPGAGIRSIDVTGAEPCGTVTDRHGNDLSLRGSFTRTDGRRGLAVDVLFRVE
jgi:hypothetical protein